MYHKWSSFGWYVNKTDYLKGLVDTELILGMFSKNEEKARKLFLEYMGKESNEKYIDLSEPKAKTDKEEAHKIYEEMCKEGNSQTEILKGFKERTGISLREIADITGINKDKICRLIRT